MDNKPMISVIMSAYNAESYIGAAIESVLSQTFRDFELIIIDDASTDSTPIIIDRYVATDSRIIFLKNKVNLYATISRNKAIDRARGEYIAIQDADDISFPKRLETQLVFLESNHDVFLVGSGAYIINESNNITSKFAPITGWRQIHERLLKENCIYHSTVMFRNSSERYREKIYHAEDYDFYLNLLSQGKRIENISDTLLCYRVLPSSISRMKGGQQALFVEKIREFYFERINTGGDSYKDFNPQDILTVSGYAKNKVYLKGEIRARFRVNDFKEVRKLVLKYTLYFGLSFEVIFYFILSLAGPSIISYLRSHR